MTATHASSSPSGPGGPVPSRTTSDHAHEPGCRGAGAGAGAAKYDRATASEHTTGDEGGEAPCFAHLLDEPAGASETILAQLVTELADAVVLADADGRITFWNEAATRLFGFTAAEALGRSLDLIIPERFRDRHWSGYQQVMASGRTSYGDRLLEVPALHRDGRSLSIAFTVSLLRRPDARRPFAIAAVIRDDTDRWQERRQLRAEIAELRSARETSE